MRERGRERDTGWGRDRLRDHAVVRSRESLGEDSRQVYPGNNGRDKQNAIFNWRDHKDISSFYFTRFSDDITEKELWYHFKKWGDVKEIFIPNRRNYNGGRYGFVRFKGVNDANYLAKQLDKIVIGGLKLYVNIPRHGREMQRKGASGNKQKNYAGSNQVEIHGDAGQNGVKQGSYAAALLRNIRNMGQRPTYRSQVQRHQASSSSVHLDIGLEENNWLKDAWVGRLRNLAMFDRLEEEILWETGMDLSTKYIGGDLVLLLTDERAAQVMNGGQYGGALLFYSMEKWSPSICTSYRLTWVQCWGIPLQAWDMRHSRRY